MPQLRLLPPGEAGRVFALETDHVGIETFDDLAGQITWSHHWTELDGRLLRHSAPYRYVWPSELDLMPVWPGCGSATVGRLVEGAVRRRPAPTRSRWFEKPQ